MDDPSGVNRTASAAAATENELRLHYFVRQRLIKYAWIKGKQFCEALSIEIPGVEERDYLVIDMGGIKDPWQRKMFLKAIDDFRGVSKNSSALADGFLALTQSNGDRLVEFFKNSASFIYFEDSLIVPHDMTLRLTLGCFKITETCYSIARLQMGQLPNDPTAPTQSAILLDVSNIKGSARQKALINKILDYTGRSATHIEDGPYLLFYGGGVETFRATVNYSNFQQGESIDGMMFI